MDTLNALDAATDEFGRRLAAVGDAAWSLPTPCTGWDVHYLAAHVIGGNRFAALVLSGVPASDAIERVMATPQFGDDPIGAWETTTAIQNAAFTESGAMERRIDHPLGAMSGQSFLELRVFDITLHAWDLARSIGVDEELAPPLVDVVLEVIERGPPGMGFGITAVGRVRPTASPQARLLDLTGRGEDAPATVDDSQIPP